MSYKCALALMHQCCCMNGVTKSGGQGGVRKFLGQSCTMQVQKRIQVSWECQNQMFRNEKETGDDIRLSTRLFKKCLTDQQKFCKDVEPGHMRVQECLEDNIEEADFSAECKSELEEMIAKRVADFRLDTALREACESDLKDTCGTTLKEMDEVRFYGTT